MNAIHLTKAQQFWPLTDYMSGFGVPIGRYVMLAAVMAAGLVPVAAQAQQAAAIDFSAVDAHTEL